jgi:hypothetical protein
MAGEPNPSSGGCRYVVAAKISVFFHRKIVVGSGSVPGLGGSCLLMISRSERGRPAVAAIKNHENFVAIERVFG